MSTDEFRPLEINRRQFLGSSALNAAGVAAGMVGVGLAENIVSFSPNNRVSVGVIGVRSQGKTLATQLAEMPDVRVATLCDVDDRVLGIAAREVEDIQHRSVNTVRDFRKLLDNRSLDAVVIATPDHWHTVMTILACQAEKDVYLESPVSHSFRDGQRMVEIARGQRRVVQVGLQQRSGQHFQSAIEYLRSGKLGAVRLAKAWITHRRKPIGFKKDEPTPTGVDYNLWLGPAPLRPFNPNRFHQNWRRFWDYGGGELGHWGVHLLDIARWGLDVELPTRISSIGGKYHFHDDQETPDTQTVTYAFPGKTIVWEHRLWTQRGLEGRNAAVSFYGDRGTLVIDRGGWKAYDVPEPISCDTSEQSLAHLRNFIDCIKSRNEPVASLETGFLSSGLCHLGNISHRVNREIRLDTNSLTIPSDREAENLLGGISREPWNLTAKANS